MLFCVKLTESTHLVQKNPADRLHMFILTHNCDHRLWSHSEIIIVNVCPTDWRGLRKLCSQKYETTTGNTVSVCNNWFLTAKCTMFGGRSPACSQSCKIVKLPPSGMGVCSATCDCKWRTKQWGHNMHLLHSFKLTPMHAHLDLLISVRLSKILMHKEAGHLSYHSQHQILWTKYELYLFNCYYFSIHTVVLFNACRKFFIE